jgi:hypothetical protein
LDQPWEQDAFAKQELVFRRAINDWRTSQKTL